MQGFQEIPVGRTDHEIRWTRTEAIKNYLFGIYGGTIILCRGALEGALYEIGLI